MIKYTVQRIGRKNEGDGVAFCRNVKTSLDPRILTYKCSRALRNSQSIDNMIVGQWMNEITARTEKDMVYYSHLISRALYESNSSAKSIERKIVIYTQGLQTFVAEVEGSLKIVDNCFDIDKCSIVSVASVMRNTIYFNSKSSWLYKAITNYKINI